ncbi:MAG: class I SAM-dependent methyltransferase [Dehalococcoidia bacterium]
MGVNAAVRLEPRAAALLSSRYSRPYNYPMTPEAEIRRRIQERGRITFAEFMELALFWPQGGYYLGPEPVGAAGDFYTSPLVHPAFGALLAVQLYQMWQLLESPDPFTVAELGAGNGLLCRDILAYAEQLPAPFRQSLRYLCLDRRRTSGVERDISVPVGASPPSRLTAAGVPLQGLRGCVLSNEFLDAFPVHQVRRVQGELREVYVTLVGDELAETLDEPSTPELAARLERLGINLAEGQTAEINLGLGRWANEVVQALESGFLLTIDYGQRAEELYSAELRPRGTLTTFYQHLQTDAPLRRVGQQDITAQVDFTSVVNAGRQAGLTLMGFELQRQFLSHLGLGHFQRKLMAMTLPMRQAQTNRAGMVDLSRPGGLGDFKVLAQGKNVGKPTLWGFELAPEAMSLVDKLPVPLLTEHHLSLLEGRYPQTEVELDLEQLWPGEAETDPD